MWDWILQQFSENQFFNGAIAAGVIGGTLVWLKTSSSTAFSWLSRYTSSGISFTDEDKLMYFLACNWVKREKIYNSPRKVQLVRNNIRSPWQEELTEDEHDSEKVFDYADNDYYWTMYQGRPVKVTFESKDTQMGHRIRTMRIVFYFRGPSFVEQMRKQFMTYFLEHTNKLKTKLRLFTQSGSSYDAWNLRVKEPRIAGSLWLPPDIHALVYGDLHAFLKAKPVYDRIGKPYRRNYLFHGPPGTGKTSWYQILAYEFNRPVYVFTELTSASKLKSAWSEIPKGSIVVLEDVDCAGANIKGRTNLSSESDEDLGEGQLVPVQDVDKKDDKPGPGPVMSLLFSYLDGAHSVEDLIIILVTNHPEKLDPAFLRKGRVDVNVAFRYAKPDEARDFIVRVEPDLDPEAVERSLEEHTNGDGLIPPCNIQEVLYQLVLSQDTINHGDSGRF